MNKLKIISLTASMVLAMVFTFSCSDDGGGNNNTSICGDKEYNAAIYTCDKGELVGFCRGNSYYPEYQYCDSNGEIKEGTEISSSSLSSVGSSSSSSSAGGRSSSSSSVGGGQSSSSSSSVGGQVGGSSSSVGGGQSSSSSSSVGGQVGGSCVGFVEGTEREHYGKMKKQFCDERDGQKYVYVTIGEGETAQTWMAENLNYAPSSGTFISCDRYDCATYGRLYDWSTAMGFASNCNSGSCSNQIQSPHQGICPSGWHIPSQSDWNVLGDDAMKLKTPRWNGMDEYGFSALPGGFGYSDGRFDYYGGYWWSASEDDSGNAYYLRMLDIAVRVGWSSYNESGLYSVRCLQD